MIPIQSWAILAYVGVATIYLFITGLLSLFRGRVIYMRDQNGDPTEIDFRLMEDFKDGTIEVETSTGERVKVFDQAFSKTSVQLNPEL